MWGKVYQDQDWLVLLCQPVRESSYCACVCVHVCMTGACTARTCLVYDVGVRQFLIGIVVFVCTRTSVTEAAVFLLLCLRVALASEYRRRTLAGFVHPGG